jgi:hypothetical protein
MLANLSPEEREQVEAQQEKMRKGMADLGHVVTKLAPSKEDPDAVVPQHKVMIALASAPCMDVLGLDESQLLGPTMDADKAKEALSKLEDKLEEIGAFPKDSLNDLSECHWRNAVLLYWHLHKASQEEFAATLPGEIDHFRGGANQFATSLLIKCQMAMPQQRWVQVTLAVARLSALVANALHSHEDEGELGRMRTILAGDGLTYPKLTLTASAHPRESNAPEVTAGQHVVVAIELAREHAAAMSSGAAPPCNNPQGIYEAYWLYVEGIKPDGTPNSLIVAKPVVVQDVSLETVKAEAVFQSPPNPGTYQLRVHITSTSVVGVNLDTDVSFVVVEDDVPDLE